MVTGNIVITLDFDNVMRRSQEDLLSFLRHLYQEKRIKKVYRRLSSSGRGYHYKVVLAKLPTYIMENLNDRDLRTFKWALRFIFGEDFGRLKIDSYRIKAGLQEEILFYRKDGQQAGEWEELI